MLLPIVHRELRVSARNKATHRLRLLFAAGAVVIGGAIGLITLVSGGGAAWQPGMLIFGALRWLAFVFACAAGVFLTSDCLSEEKREGTLGLLFLTDLRGFDVVLGKLLATSLRAFYSMLAVFPVMALSFVLGGVAADDFRHSLLSLCNVLLFSLSLGMLISVVSRDANKAMTAAAGALAVFLFVLPGLDWLLLGRSTNIPLIGLLSPAFSFTHTDSFHASEFWWSMALVQLAAWCCLALASWLAPKTWHEKAVRPGPAKGWRLPLIGPGGGFSGGRKLLDENPVCWFISRDRWASSLARLAILLALGVLALSLVSLFQGPGSSAAVAGPVVAVGRSTTTTSTNVAGTSTTTVTWGGSRIAGVRTNLLFILASGSASVLSFVLEFWLCSHVCRFYVDGKRNGFLELLLVTPVTQAEILAGHWLALRRLFLPPVVAQLALALACGAIQLWAANSAVVVAAPAGAGAATAAGRTWEMDLQQIITVALGVASWCIGLVTLVWFSIWMGITSKRTPIAMLRTFWYAKILPWFGMSFAAVLLLFATLTRLGGGVMWIWPLIIQGLYIGVNFALIAFARRRARTAFTQWTNQAVA
jgi:ABC-type transport system involved in multi-copper enzyme maturation permease subunit